MSENQKVSFRKRPDYVFGGIYPEQKVTVLLNKEGGEDQNPLYPVYSTDMISQVLKVRSKAWLAGDQDLLNQASMTHDGVEYICWFIGKHAPITVPLEMLEFVKKMEEKDYGFPIMLESIAGGVAHQPVRIWIMVPEVAKEFLPKALSELKRWISTSRRWWENHGTGSMREKTLAAILRS